MFVKCYFAPLWEAAMTPKPPLLPPTPVVPKVQLDPIYLPALCYAAESPTREYLGSLLERFQQARRHAQGIAELSYILLQYVRLCMCVGFFTLPFVTHRGILCIMWKMFTVHITNAVQASAFCMAQLVAIPALLRWISAGGVSTMLASATDFLIGMGITTTHLWYWILVVAVPAQIMMAIGPISWSKVMEDCFDGRYDKGLANSIEGNPAKPTLTTWQRLSITAQLQLEAAFFIEPSIVVLGMIPELMASWSLARGAAFEYLVAGKPVKPTMQ